MADGGGQKADRGGQMAGDRPDRGSRSAVDRTPPTTSRPSRKLPPGIRTWRDGRVLKDAMQRYEIIVIGCSMGGMHALQMIFTSFPKNFAVPIAVVQHRYRTSGEVLPSILRQGANLKVVDALDKQWIEPGTIYLAPADYHLLVERGELSLSVDARVEYSRPSIDVLFESAADAYGPAAVGVVLTGANADGARGAAKIKEKGGFVVVQDPATAEAPEMPSAAIGKTRVDRILPLDRIGPFLVELCRFSKP
jgi:two-component system, chemotaxis family, protein-glutamate methylesterase/glutaminase